MKSVYILTHHKTTYILQYHSQEIHEYFDNFYSTIIDNNDRKEVTEIKTEVAEDVRGSECC